MRYLVRAIIFAIIFGSIFGNTFGITFSAAKVLLFFDIHKFMSKKNYTFFPFVFHRVTVVLSTMVSVRKIAILKEKALPFRQITQFFQLILSNPKNCCIFAENFK